MEYNHKNIEKKWQKVWYDNKMFKANDFDDKEKYFALVEFPYPSGAGMHVGHIRAYTSLEIISRKRRMEGYNVLFPIGFDAFGLPTENFALKNKIHPKVVTKNNIETFTKQLKETGFSFDFDRVTDTTQEDYYKWTQFIFAKLYEHKLAYKSKTFVNFCPDCKVVLANEESQGGKCDRCDSPVVQMEKNVWFLKISEYAEKLLEELPNLDFLPRIKTEQENWIGKSSGALVSFEIEDSKDKLDVFTTRPDTIFGATFMVIAPEHDIVEKYKERIKNISEIEDYKKKAHMKTEFERVHMNKEKTGVKLDGLFAINPLTKGKIEIFVADYVMNGYGTGAIMAVPAHDTRDYEFAKKYNCKIVEVIAGGDISKEAFTNTSDGTLINSDFLNGKSVKEAKIEVIKYLEKNKIGKENNNYKMKDWAFNRQRYWGEPIPIIYCDDCGEILVPYEQLPVMLPQTDLIAPTDTGESPLANVEEFINCTCPKCGKKAKRETDTMPQWAGSSWYYLRFIDTNNNKEFAAMDKMKYWGQVDWYNGGMEHVTRHLIYSRFWHRFLYDIGLVPTKEPYKKRTAQGLILGPDGEKMSKSKGNVVDVTTVIDEHGADTLRLYLMFIGDYEQATPWSDQGVKGCRRFVERVYRLFDNVDLKNNELSKDLEILINQTIKKVGTDYEEVKFNTAIASLMSLVNEFYQKDSITKGDYEVLIKLLYPIAPHITEELNSLLGNKESLVFVEFPKYDESKLEHSNITLMVQVNGKLKGKVEVSKDDNNDIVIEKVLKDEKVKASIDGLNVVKTIVVPKKLVNIVVK